MKRQLQNNYTTPEQSKRLLELGLPADSADMYYKKTGAPMKAYWHRAYLIQYDEYINFNETDAYHFRKYLPCWSVGRLIEIHAACGRASSSYYIHTFPTNILNEVIWHLTEAVQKGWVDFSKLNEEE